MPSFSRVDFHLRVPSRARLTLGFVDSWALDGAEPPGHRLVIDYETAGGTKVRSFEVDAAGIPDTVIELGNRDEELARISFRALPPEPGLLGKGLRLVGLRKPEAFPGGVRVRAPALRGAGAPRVPTPEPPSPRVRRNRAAPNVIVYLIDTLRADRLGCYGYPKPVSPHIDRFAGEAILFERPLAQSSWTRASVISLFTGLYPQAHGVVGRKHSLPASAVTLASLLREQGYRTAAFVTNVNVSREFGLAKGFERYESLDEQRTVEIHQLSDRLNEVAFEWLEREAHAPFFLYLHATDPHAPYTPREPFRSQFAAGVRLELGHIENVKRLTAGRRNAEPGEREALAQLYDAEVAFNDASFGALLARLRELDLYDSTIVFLVSDHGEEFLEHGGWQHGLTLYQEQLEVPFLMKLPRGEPAGRRVDARAELVDVLPTVLDYLAAEGPRGLQGRSLLPVLDGSAAERPGFAHLDLDGVRFEAMIDGPHKLIRRLPARPWSHIELYDLSADPGERHDVSEALAIEAGYLSRRLAPFARDPAAAAPEVDVGGEIDDRLRSLGYLQ